MTTRTVADARNALAMARHAAQHAAYDCARAGVTNAADAAVQRTLDALIAVARRAAFAEAADKLRDDARFGSHDHADPGEPLTTPEGSAFERAALRVGAMS